MLIDSHCHLDFEDFAAERDAVVERARMAGLKRIITISTRTASFASLSRLADSHEEVFCTVGTHPHNAHDEADISPEQLTHLALHPIPSGDLNLRTGERHECVHEIRVHSPPKPSVHRPHRSPEDQPQVVYTQTLRHQHILRPNHVVGKADRRPSDAECPLMTQADIAALGISYSLWLSHDSGNAVI